MVAAALADDMNWDQVHSNANATGSINFAAPNVTAPFPNGTGNSGFILVDGWTLSIDIGASDGTQDSQASAFFSISGPPALFNPSNGSVQADSSWDACVYSHGLHAVNNGFSNGTQFGDGDCEGALGKDCAQDWLAAAVNIGGRLGGSQTCPTVTLPDTCQRAFKDQGSYSAGMHGLVLGPLTSEAFFFAYF